MDALPIKYLKIDIPDSEFDELKTIIPETFDFVKEYKSDMAKKQTLLGRYLLIKNLNCKETDIYYNALKKPYAKNNLYFNISHTKDLVVFVSSKNEIGIDIEYIDKKNMDILDYAFTKKEISFVKDGNGIFESADERFTLVWTIKESLFKASGTEKSVEPRDIETVLDNFNTNAISDNNVIENKINFLGTDYYVYSIKYLNFIISAASIDKYSDLNLICQN